VDNVSPDQLTILKKKKPTKKQKSTDPIFESISAIKLNIRNTAQKINNKYDCNILLVCK